MSIGRRRGPPPQGKTLANLTCVCRDVATRAILSVARLPLCVHEDVFHDAEKGVALEIGLATVMVGFTAPYGGLLLASWRRV